MTSSVIPGGVQVSSNFNFHDLRSSVRILTVSFALMTAMSASAATVSTGVDKVRRKSPSQAVMNQAILNNEMASRYLLELSPLLGTPTTVRPFADYEKTGYVFISDSFTFGSQSAKEAIAANLPKDVTLVVFMEDVTSIRAASLRQSYEKFVTPDRLKLVALEDASDGFWARDGLPVPVIEASGALGLVDAKYYYPFEPDKQVGLAFDSQVRSHRFNFEGGNFMANHMGHCILVNNNSHSRIPDAIFETLYGCSKIQRLPHVSGIGHIDEHVRFISEDTVMTDLPSYKKALEAAGLKTILLPRPENEIETYVNSLLVNGVAIVPVFGQPTDKEALDIYTAAGIKAVAGDSKDLSNYGEGSIHCITMTYPPVALKTLLKSIGAKEIH